MTAATDIDSPAAHERVNTGMVDSASADAEASDLAISILSVHYLVPKYLTGAPGLLGNCAGCQWCGRFGSPKDARAAHGAHVLDELRSNGCHVVGIHLPDAT